MLSDRFCRPAALLFPASVLLFSLCGCLQQTLTSSTSATQSQASIKIQGMAHGGLQPITGATVNLYTVNTTSDGGASTLIASTQTSTSLATPGAFSITGDYSCSTSPLTSNSLMYITITGGSAGGGANPNIVLMAALGQCSAVASSSFIDVNEVTTVAAVYALAPYMTSSAAIGASHADSVALASDFAIAAEYANTANGTSPGPNVQANLSVPATQIYTIANILSSCVNTTGGVATDTSTVCGGLFNATTPSGGPAPTDTIGAMIDLANNPTGISVSTLYSLITSGAPYAGYSSSSDVTDWSVNFGASATYSGPAIATGDARTNVARPTYPAICQTLTAQFPASDRTLTGASAISSSADDTARIQAALTTCANTGQAVELAADPGSGDTGFFSGLITVNGEGLIIDSGVTLYGNDQYVTSSELVDIKGTNSSLMGPGTIDGRSDIITTTKTPRLVEADPVTNFNVYNVTLMRALHPALYVEAGNGVTIWNVTIRTPANQNSADGIDIDSSTNVTVANNSIAAGDDGVAVKNNSANSSNVTVQNNRLYGTHGLTIGSIVSNTVSNVLFQNNYVYGNGANFFSTSAQNDATTANAINIKTYPYALTVQQITYLNTCITTAKHLIIIQTNYTGSATSTTTTPLLSDIVINGVTATSSQSGAYTLFYGYSSADPLTAYLAHVSLDSNAANGDTSTPNQYANLYLYNSSLTPTGTGISNDTSDFSIAGSAPSCAF